MTCFNSNLQKTWVTDTPFPCQPWCHILGVTSSIFSELCFTVPIWQQSRSEIKGLGFTRPLPPQWSTSSPGLVGFCLLGDVVACCIQTQEKVVVLYLCRLQLTAGRAGSQSEKPKHHCALLSPRSASSPRTSLTDRMEAVMDPGNEEFSICLLKSLGFKVSSCHKGWGSALVVTFGRSGMCLRISWSEQRSSLS